MRFLELTVVYGGDEPTSSLHVAHGLSDSTMSAMIGANAVSDLKRTPEVLLQAIAGNQQKLDIVREIMFDPGYGNCNAGCAGASEPECAITKGPYFAIVEATLARRGKVLCDYTHPTINTAHLADLKRRLVSYNGMHSPAAAAQIKALRSELTGLYRLPLLQAHDLESIRVSGLVPDDDAVIERASQWRLAIERIREEMLALDSPGH